MSAHYGTVDARLAILQGLADAGAKSLTADETSGSQAHDSQRPILDHVAFAELAGLGCRLETVPSVVDGHRISDRDGVLVELTWS
ncbi:hypothetical protein [Azohydromonas aeria]|uniref:hypothetical protein n=1 Tax=Azohydromonas aeria TaxID=2590212 RepID=UPI0012FBD6D7|nr:hypothetical protein [Azohydromonas aeria]